MRSFRSVRELVWWVQNNGGGSVEIEINNVMSDAAVKVKVAMKDPPGEFVGCGSFLNEAVTRIRL